MIAGALSSFIVFRYLLYRLYKLLPRETSPVGYFGTTAVFLSANNKPGTEFHHLNLQCVSRNQLTVDLTLPLSSQPTL
jgi:hypothetical protein